MAWHDVKSWPDDSTLVEGGAQPRTGTRKRGQRTERESNHEQKHPFVDSTGCDDLQWLCDGTTESFVNVNEQDEIVLVDLLSTRTTDAGR